MDGVVVFRILNMCVLAFCVVSVVWSVWHHGSFHGFWFVDLAKLYFWALQLIFNFPKAIFMLDRVQKKPAQLTNHMNDSDW